MWCLLRRVFLNVLICLLLSMQVSESLYIKPGYENFARIKRGHTTVCVEIKPSVAGSHEPYYMCKGPEFPVRPPNMPNPPQVVKTNTANYPTHNLQFENGYQQPPQLPGVIKSTGESHPPQNLQFGNAYQQPAPIYPAPENQAHFQTPPLYTPYPMPPQIPNYSPATFMNHHQYPQAVNQPTIADFPTHNHNPAKVTTSNLPNNYESNLQPPTTFRTSELSQHYDTSRAEPLTDDTLKTAANSGQQQADSKDLPTLALKEAVEHKINAEKFNALIEDEVLGMPNLAFSHDEMLPIHNLYNEDKMRQPSLESNIPAEYLDDPILRTFYNINNNPGKPEEETYYPQTAQLNQAAMGNMDDCFDPYTQLQKPAYMPSAEPTAHMDSFKNPYSESNNCCGCPFSFQPIFIAIPWFSPAYHELFTQMHPTAYAQLPVYETYPAPPSNSAQSRVSEDQSTTTEDLTNKKPTTQTEIKTNSTQPLRNTTKTPESSEEELFVEDTTTKNDKSTKTEDEESLEDTKDDEVEELQPTTTTSAPFTTVRTFKTLMHAAKVASGLYKNPDPNLQNKRQVHYITAPVYPNTYKRQYVRKLEKMYN